MVEYIEESRREEYQELQQLVAGIGRQAIRPPDNDHSIGRLFTAFQHHLDAYPDSSLIEPLNLFAKHRKDRHLVDNLGTLRSALTVDALIRYNPREPYDKLSTFTLPRTIDEWEESIGELATGFAGDRDPAIERRVEQFMMNLITKDNQASTESRYTPAAWVGALYGLERWREEVTVLDIGAASRQGINSFALKKDFGLHRASILGERNQEDRRLSVAYNYRIRRFFRFRSGVAVDALDIHTEDDKLWPIGNLRHETEIGNEEFMERYLRNANERPQSVAFQRVDFGCEDETARFFDRHPEKFHLAIMSMMLHQNKADNKWHHVVKAALRATRDDGVLIVQDKLQVPGNGLFDLELVDNWFDDSQQGKWSVAVYDKQHPELGWQVLFTSPRSRFEELLPVVGIMQPNGTPLLPLDRLED